MRSRRPSDVRAWLAQEPPLGDLIEAFPIEWKSVEGELKVVLSSGDGARFRDYVATVSRPAAPSKRGDEARLSAEVRQHLALAAVRRMCVAAATGVTSGRVRFNLLNGWLLQRLLFKHDLERKPASMLAFRLLWPLMWQRKFLMILVQPKGIYCFYSKQLVARLASIVGSRSCVEIAAGDGTLSRFLREAGVNVTATDDHSWNKTVAFPDDVVKEDARKALKKRLPEVVVCSWPPAGNDFECEVFRTTSVQTYIVISSQHEFGTGNWNDYRSQSTFTLTPRPDLARLVLPPEVDPAVYVFERSS